MATTTISKGNQEQPVVHHHDDHQHHGGSFRLYWGIAIILLIATVAEVALAEVLKGELECTVAAICSPALVASIEQSNAWAQANVSEGVVAGSMMAIAVIKAALVILYYMHLRYEKAILWVIFSIPFGLVSLLAIALFLNP
jgi:caa(3)-type oxidase subunit IV